MEKDYFVPFADFGEERWMHPVVLLNGNNRLTEQPVVLWLLIKPEMFMQVQVQPFILLNRIKSRIGNWKK